MLELKEKANPLGESPAAASGEPASLLALRARSQAAFLEAGLPTVKHEEWKYTSLRELAATRFEAAASTTITQAELDATPAGNLSGPRMVFVNGFFDATLSHLDGLGDGVSAKLLSEAVAEDADSVLRHLGQIATFEGKLGSFNDERFVWLNNGQFREGAFVHVKRMAEGAAPLNLIFLTRADQPAEVFPRLLIELEEGAQLTVNEAHIGLAGSYFTGPVAEIVLAPNATLHHNRLQFETGSAFHIGTLAVRQDRDSTYNSTTAAFGAKISRLDTSVWVGGEHAETSLNGVYVGDGDQVIDNHTRIDHALPNCHSFEVYKGILDGKAQGVFNGKIFVYKDAQKTDAKQTNQALLLSKTAGVNTKPQLEIFADDVKCTHGATVGQLREDALFYLRARGIPESEARNILVYAFAAEVFEGIADDAARNELERLLYQKLGVSEE